MKILVFICGLHILVATACGQTRPPIQSIHDVQPYLEKYLGTPTKIDTSYKGIVYDDFTTLVYRYNQRPDLSYQKISDVLSKGFGEPAHPRGKSNPSYRGVLIPLIETRWGIIYKVQFAVVSLNPPSFIICVFDDKNEIPIPTE